MILYYFKTEFPLKTIYVSDLNRNKLHGIKISSKRMRLLNKMNKIITLMRKTQDHINRYQKNSKGSHTRQKIGMFKGKKWKKNVANNN
jgi:hypothetical protein